MMLPPLWRTAAALVPAGAWLAVAAAVAGAVVWWHLARVADARDAGRAEVQARWDAQRAAHAEVAASAAHAARAEERRREAALRKEMDDALQAVARARADADRAAGAAERLRHAARAAAARCGAATGDTATAAASAAATGAGDLLAELLRAADERAGALAAEADRRGIAGTACERAYDALTAPGAVGSAPLQPAPTGPR